MTFHKSLQLCFLSSALAFGWPGTASADLCEKTPAVNLNVVSSEEVDNDLVRMNWQVQIQAPTASEAMAAVNTVIEQSIASLSRNRDISKMKNNLQTYPQYNRDQAIQAWQGIGTLSFEMPVQALKQQKSLNVADGLTLSNLEYFPSETRIEQSRARLLQTAMKAFQTKALTVAKGFGKSSYTLGEVSINDENFNISGPPRVFAAAEMVRSSKSMDVSQAAGSSRQSVSVSGRVCLNP